MPCMACRGFYPYVVVRMRIGTDLCWQVEDNLRLDPVETLPDGSYLAEVSDSVPKRRRLRPVRVIGHYIADDRQGPGRVCLLK